MIKFALIAFAISVIAVLNAAVPGGHPFHVLMTLAFVFIAAAVYFLPAIVAACRHHHNQLAIFALNLLLGWTFGGWVIAMIWACMARSTTTVVISSSIDR